MGTSSPLSEECYNFSNASMQEISADKKFFLERSKLGEVKEDMISAEKDHKRLIEKDKLGEENETVNAE